MLCLLTSDRERLNGLHKCHTKPAAPAPGAGDRGCRQPEGTDSPPHALHPRPLLSEFRLQFPFLPPHTCFFLPVGSRGRCIEHLLCSRYHPAAEGRADKPPPPGAPPSPLLDTLPWASQALLRLGHHHVGLLTGLWK